MLGEPFYHETIKRSVSVFGTLFNNISIERDDGAVDKEIYKIPLSYGPTSKFNAIMVPRGPRSEENSKLGEL